MTMGDPYRFQCPTCEELRQKLARYEGHGHKQPKLWPKRQFWDKKTCCVYCDASLVLDSPRRGWLMKRSHQDGIACTGRRSLLALRWKCPPVPHLHRYCSQCEGRWIEAIE